MLTEITQTIMAWNGNFPQYENWLKANQFSYCGEGKSSVVFADRTKSFVVKVVKPNGLRMTFDCYLHADKYAPYSKGAAGDKDLNEYFVRVKNLYQELLLFPAAMSEDFCCCVQRYMQMDRDKVLEYIGSKLKIPDNPAGRAYRAISGGKFPLGPIENVGWCEQEEKPYVIDLR